MNNHRDLSGISSFLSYLTLHQGERIAPFRGMGGVCFSLARIEQECFIYSNVSMSSTYPSLAAGSTLLLFSYPQVQRDSMGRKSNGQKKQWAKGCFRIKLKVVVSNCASTAAMGRPAV